jgi:hypothetical protein
VAADLDADSLGDERRSPAPCCEIHLTETALSEQALNLVFEPRLRAGDDLPDRKKIATMVGRTPTRRGACGRF